MQGLLDTLEEGARERPDEAVLHFVEDSLGATRTVGWAELRDMSLRAMGAYREAGLLPGQRVVLSLPTSPELVAGLLGAFRAGLHPAIVAPLSARRGTMAAAELQTVIDQLRPDAVIGIEHGRPGTMTLEADALLRTPGRAEDEALGTTLVAQSCYVQFSSGSTGLPKGLELPPEGIAANLEMMRHAIPMPADDHVVSWLPMYHDMGLFGTLLLAIWSRAQVTLMDPSLFVRNPLLWLRTIQRQRSTITACPPSAVAAVLALLSRRPQDDLDLSTCTRFICGAEQVTPTLVRDFREVMPRYGVSPDALKPVYGLAETTLAVSMPPHDRGQVVHEKEVGGAREWVSVGRALDGLVVELRDETGAVVDEGEVGRLFVKGPCLYRARIEAGVATAREEEWLDTGDLAFRAGDEYCICGRVKDIIIQGGRNYTPERIEELATVTDGVLRGAAFGVHDPRRQTERVVLACEVHPRVARDAAARDTLRLELRRGLKAAGYDVDEILLTTRGALPLTTSGKIRRAACRELVLSGELPRADVREAG